MLLSASQRGHETGVPGYLAVIAGVLYARLRVIPRQGGRLGPPEPGSMRFVPDLANFYLTELTSRARGREACELTN